jgi:hypothetical protein
VPLGAFQIRFGIGAAAQTPCLEQANVDDPAGDPAAVVELAGLARARAGHERDGDDCEKAAHASRTSRAAGKFSPARHRERVREGATEEVARVEGRPDDDVAVVELRCEPAELGEPHPVMLARAEASGLRSPEPGSRAAGAAREPAIDCYGQAEPAQVWSASAWA